jgi:hypothetical protein
MAVVLTLGPLLFTDFEVPESINVGGKQILVVHKLIGGSRVIQAMGRDDDDIKWSGRFRGSAAEIRTRLADFLRVQGQPLVLAWSSFRYLVMVEFKADFHQQYEIPYSISCTVVSDLTNPVLTAVLGVDAAISSDLNQAIQVGAQLNVPGITSAISGISTATAAVETFQGAATTDVSAAMSAVGLAQTAIAGQTDIQNAVVAASGNVAGVVAGLDPATIASNLTSQASAFSQLGQLYQLKALVGRMGVNISNAGS